ncbi:MAG TPA: hypothetical protein VFT87_01530 [Candidatus Saccharimonadales bacterium]|nr:hypothetical protein [Candidatus Saccharimonadales bacterium]
MTEFFANGRRLVEDEQRRRRKQTGPTLEFMATGVFFLLLALFGITLPVASRSAVFGLSAALQLGFAGLGWWNRLFGENLPWIKVAIGVGTCVNCIVALLGFGVLLSALAGEQF